jgi:aspartate racemase
MNLPFYKNKLLAEYGINVITPPEEKFELIFKVIKEKLTHNIIKEESREIYLEIIDELYNRGAQGVILGCTEIPMLIKQEHTRVPVFDTTDIHALTAAEIACLR